MKAIEDYIKTLPKNRLDTPDISLVLFDYDTGMDLYLFRINLSEDTCMMMSSPTLDCPYCELFTPFISQLDMYYHNYGIKKDSWAIGKNYRKIMKELTGK